MLSDDKQDDAACGSIQPKHLPVGDAPTAGKMSASTRVSRRFRGWRGWVLRIALLVVSPVSSAAWPSWHCAAGYGYPTSFFLGPDERGLHLSNVQFGWRFFPRQLARKPEPCLLLPRSPDTTRIFILGESAALGMPNPAFSFGRILEVTLRERYPGCRFEVVNTSMTAINSHAILEIAKACSSQGGDLFVIYMGNNEVVGPYGPGTVFQQVARSGAAVRTAVWVKSTRFGQLMSDIADRFRGSDDVPANWQGMQMFLGNRVPSEDPRLTLVYDNFHRNLAGICDVARGANAAVILSTVAVNLQDCPPLASLHRPDLSADDLSRWNRLYASGAEAESRREWDQALQHWQGAAEIDDRYAELQYRLGQCLAALDRRAECKSDSNRPATWTLCGFAPIAASMRSSARWRRLGADRMSVWPMPNAFSRKTLASIISLEKSSSTNTCISRSRATISWRKRFSSRSRKLYLLRCVLVP